MKQALIRNELELILSLFASGSQGGLRFYTQTYSYASRMIRGVGLAQKLKLQSGLIKKRRAVARLLVLSSDFKLID